jgi:hypothetical protein
MSTSNIQTLGRRLLVSQSLGRIEDRRVGEDRAELPSWEAEPGAWKNLNPFPIFKSVTEGGVRGTGPSEWFRYFFRHAPFDFGGRVFTGWW